MPYWLTMEPGQMELRRGKGRVSVSYCSNNNDIESFIPVSPDMFALRQFDCVFSVSYHHRAELCCSFQYRHYTNSTQLSLSTVHVNLHENPEGKKTYVTTHAAQTKLGFVTETQKVFCFSSMSEGCGARCDHDSVFLARMYRSQELWLDSEWEAC